MMDLLVVHDDDNAIHADWLIRCRDCKYAKEHGSYSVFGKQLFVCKHIRQVGREGLEIHTGDWFCADGRRKDEDQG